LLGQPVPLAPDCVGEAVEARARSLEPGQVLLLENLRFHPEEEANDPVFAGALARLADCYVNDAFASAHRRPPTLGPSPRSGGGPPRGCEIAPPTPPSRRLPPPTPLTR